jgi:hypothetical protein
VVPLSRHVEAVKAVPPQDLKNLQQFLGMNNLFNRRFLPGDAGALQPLPDAHQGLPKCLVWTEPFRRHFLPPKAALFSK